MHCRSCGQALADGQGFCAGCGTPREASSEAGAAGGTVFCTSCGVKNAADANHCTSCGAGIGGQATAAIADLSRAVTRSAGQLTEAIGSDEMRSNPWASAVIGALAATAIGVAVMFVLRGALISYVSGFLASQASGSGGAEAAIAGSLSKSLLKSLLPTSPAMLLIAQGASFNSSLSGTAQGTSIALSVVGRSGIGLLWLVPALSLAFGGYISVRYSRVTTFLEAAMRGALLAVPYTVLCAAIALFAKKSSSDSLNLGDMPFVGSIEADLAVSSGVTFLSAVVIGAIMAVVFGALGAVYAARGKAALRDAELAYEKLRIPFREQVPLALRAVGLNLALGAITSLIAVIYVASKLGGEGAPPEFTGYLFGSWLGSLPSWAGMAALFQNAANIHLAADLPGQAVPAMYTNIWSAIAPLYGLPLVLLGAAFAILVRAGKESARTAGATEQRSAMLQAAKVAVPYSAFMMLLAYLVSSNMQITISAFVLNVDSRVFAGFGLLGSTFTVMLFSLAATALGGYLYSRQGGAAVGGGRAVTPFGTAGPAPVSATGPASVDAPGSASARVTERVCAECGRANPAAAAFCDGCGSPLDENPKREVQGGGQ